MMTDPIADLLVRIKNAAQRGHASLTVPASQLKVEIVRVLQREGFIQGFERQELNGLPILKIDLRYVTEGQPVIVGLRRISKPGGRVYVGRRDNGPVMGGMGVAILSTSSGVMTDHESRRAGIGGEVLCHVW